MEIVLNPELCAEVTLLPVSQLGVDAAILFSDIMTPVTAMGIEILQLLRLMWEKL